MASSVMTRAVSQEHDPPHSLCLLHPRRERPRRSTTEQRDPLAPFHADMGLSHPRAVGLRILSLARTARPVLWAMLNRSESADHACGAVRNVCCDMSSPREMSFELSAAPPPKPAILRELIARDIRECAR